MGVPTRPKTRYAKSDGASIAWQAFGDGPREIVVTPGFVSNIEAFWEIPGIAGFLGRLGAVARVVIWDKRGTGLSDPVIEAPTLEQKMDDLRAVMEAAETAHPTLLGISEGGPMSIVFAASYPDRVSSLVMFGSSPRFTRTDDFPHAPTMAELESLFGRIDEAWGEGVLASLFIPSHARDPDARESWGRLQRTGASPSMAIATLRAAAQLDVRGVLPAVRVPTLILHHMGDRVLPVEAARYMAEQMPNARLVELPGADHAPIFGMDAVADEIEEFLTGRRPPPVHDRVLGTVLFTDIVDSTRRAAQIGDRAWRGVLDRHDALVRRALDRHRGREIKTTGDGFLATFDGPTRSVECAREVVSAVQPLGIELRAGLHTGEFELVGDDIAGMAVNVAARVSALAGTGEVLVSSTVKDLVVGSGLEFRDSGEQRLKGVPGEWRLYSLR